MAISTSVRPSLVILRSWTYLQSRSVAGATWCASGRAHAWLMLAARRSDADEQSASLSRVPACNTPSRLSPSSSVDIACGSFLRWAQCEMSRTPRKARHLLFRFRLLCVQEIADFQQIELVVVRLVERTAR